MFEITNALVDVMICVPSIATESYLGFGNKDIIRELCALLASFRGGNPTVISILREKLGDSKMMTPSPAGFILHQYFDEDDDSREPDNTSWGVSDSPRGYFTGAVKIIYDQT